jgi:hypothetical protein
MSRRKKRSRKDLAPQSSPDERPKRRSVARRHRESLASRVLKTLHTHRVFLALLMIAVLMRIPTLGRQSLWIDEMCTWNDAAASSRHIQRTVHTVVFYLEKASQNLLGPSEFALRLPSALVATAGIVFLYLAALQIMSRQGAFIAALLMTFSPINVYYSQDSNYYGMMMGFTAATLYFMFRFFRTRNVLALAVLFVLWLLANYLNFKVHPFNIFIAAAEGVVFVAWFFLDRAFRRYWGGKLKEFLSKPASAVPVLIVAAILGGVILYSFAPRSLGYITAMLNASQGTRIAENFEPNLGFFLKLSTDYGLVFQDYTSFNFAFTFLFLGFFGVGLVWYARRNRFLLLLTLLCWTLPFVGLYLVRVTHFYHPRYTSFIVPLYLLAAAQGVTVVAGFLAERISAVRKEQIQRFLACVILCVFGVATVPNLFRYYAGEKQDWKGAVKFLKSNLKPGDRVTSYLFANNSSLVFYFRRFGMDLSVLEKLPEIRGAAFNDLYLLKKMCLGKGDVYFCTSYTRYEPPLLIDWVKGHFERVFDSPSLHPSEINREGKEVIVYRWKYKGAFVFPPFAYRLEEGSANQMQSGKQDSSSTQTVLLSKQLLFDRSGPYDLSLTFDRSAVGDALIALMLDGKMVDTRLVRTGSQSFAQPFRFRVEAGVHTLSLAGNVGDQHLPLSLPFSLSVTPTWQGTIRVRSTEADEVHPTGEKWVSEYKGKWAFTLKRNSYLKYDNVFVPEAGNYYFQLSAVNDKPGPVLMEVAWDNKLMGIVSFDKADNSWGMRGFPFIAEAGRHAVTLTFLNNNTASATKDDEDNDAILESFEIVKQGTGTSQGPDDRLRISSLLQPVPAGIERALRTAAPTAKLPPGWRIEPPMAFDYVNAQVPDTMTSIRFKVLPFSQGLTLMCAPIEVTPGKLLYFAGNIKVTSLENHSANMQVFYLDAAKQWLGASWVNVEGVTRTTGWVRFCHFGPVVQNARWVIIAYVVYQNSQRPSEGAGYVEFSDVRFESY